MRRGRALAAALVAALATGGFAPGPSGPAAPERVIVRFADRSQRTSLMTDVVRAPLTLAARHERLVTGLRSIHAASLAAAGPTLEDARAAGAFRQIDDLWIVNAVVAEVDPAWIPALEADPAILAVVPDRRLAPGVERVRAADPTAAAAPSDAMAQVGIPAVWAQGIRGQGAIVANTDSGVNGEDATLADRWRGIFAGSDASWYAPQTLTVFPVDDGGGGPSLYFGHGTATMGLLAGGEASYGVAYQATWIAGDVFEQDDGFVSTALRDLEWLTDPDGDPSTSSDVPDVVSNSYGLRTLDPTTNRIVCDPIFDDAIDALEAAGAIVVWSAGNEGGRGVTSPANRADSPVNAFAVGAVDGAGRLDSQSGIGPSACGGPNAIKPEVVAPGVGVLTRNRFDAFTQVSGTSFATPIVGGILALMRSKNPTITPEEAKTILLETAHDLETPGDDNDTGHGLVDAEAALAMVQRPSQPLARLVGFQPPDATGKGVAPAGIERVLVLAPGTTRSLVPVLTNHGPAIAASTATLSSTTPGVTFPTATVPLAAAGTGEFFGPSDGSAFEVQVAPTVAAGTPIALTVTVQGAAIGPFRMILRAGDPVSGGYATHDVGRVRLSVTNFGGLGYYTGLHADGFDLEGAGFRFPATGTNWLFHAGFMAGTGPTRLSDDVPYGEDTQSAPDWIPLFGAPIAVGNAAGGQRITARYDDRKAPDPLGVSVRQESYAFSDAGNDAYVIVQYQVTNTTARSLGGLRLGLFADWDLPAAGDLPMETAGWDADRRLGWMEGTVAGQPSVGVVWLDNVSLGQMSYRVLKRSDVLASTKGDPPAAALAPAAAPDVSEGEFSDAEKWDALAGGLSVTSVTDPQDLYQVIGEGPVTIAPGATDTVAVALVAGETRAALQAQADAARDAYFRRVLGTEPPSPPQAPSAVALLQNFPNPFRSGESTTVRFDVPDSATGTLFLGVYDLLGRRVRTLRSGTAVPGEQAVSWDGTDEEGRPVPAGVYVIRLSVEGGGTGTVRALVLP